MTPKHKKKKRVFALVLAVALLAVVGVTYAWFSQQVTLLPSSSTMGRIKVEANFGNIDQPVYLEPMPDDADPIEMDGSLKNTGTIDAFVKVDLRTRIQIRSDASGAPLSPSNYYYTTDPAVTKEAGVMFDESKLAALNAQWPFIAYKDNTSPGLYYILMPSPSNAGGNYQVDLDLTVKPSKSMGNIFQGAVLEYNTGAWQATQQFDEAVQELLGVDLWGGLMSGDLEIVLDSNNMVGPLSGNNSLRDQLMQRTYDALFAS